MTGVGLLGIYAVAWLKKRVDMDRWDSCTAGKVVFLLSVFCLDMHPERLKTAERPWS